MCRLIAEERIGRQSRHSAPVSSAPAAVHPCTDRRRLAGATQTDAPHPAHDHHRRAEQTIRPALLIAGDVARPVVFADRRVCVIPAWPPFENICKLDCVLGEGRPTPTRHCCGVRKIGSVDKKLKTTKLVAMATSFKDRKLISA